MIRFFRRRKAELPTLQVDDGLLRKLGRVIEGNIIDNIARQVQASGAALKRNKPFTQRRKRAAGWTWRGRVLSLVAQMHRFVMPGGLSWKTILPGKSTVIVRPATAELATLSRYVQQKGYTGWLGISKAGRAALDLAMQDWIKAKFLKRKRVA